MQNELSCLPQVSQGWLLFSYMHSYTSLSHKGPYDAFLASNIQLSYTNQGARLIRVQGEGGNPLARGAAGETTPALGCSCLHYVAATILSDHHECPQGSLLPLGLQAPSFPHWTTHS